MNRKAYSFNYYYQIWQAFHSASQLTSAFLVWQDFMPIEFWWTVSLLSFLLLMLNVASSLKGWPYGWGLANWITLLRYGLLVVLLFFFEVLYAEILFTGFMTVIVLDGVDGKVARRFGHSSKEGEVFDMEVDAFMVFALAYIHWQTLDTHFLVVLAGSLRYWFPFITLPWKNKTAPDLPSKKWRATIAVCFFVALVTTFILPFSVSHVLLMLTSVLIIVSFSVSLVALVTA